MKTASVILGLIVLIAGGLLIGPSFVDWNRYKPQIVEQARSAAGYDIGIAGDLQLALLPTPSLKIDGLSVKAPRGKAENLLTMKEAVVNVKLMPLLSGDIMVDTVRLVSPAIALETLPDGTNSWLSDQLMAAQDASGTESAPTAGGAPARLDNTISLDKLIIEDGSVIHVDRRTGAEQKAEKINLDLKADTLAGPYKAGGSMLYGGEMVEIELETKAGTTTSGKKEMPVKAKISLPEANAYAEYNGVVATEPTLELQGTAKIEADNLAAVLGLAGIKPSPALSRKLAFTGLITANDNELSSQDLAVTFGDAKGQGSVIVTGLTEKNPVQVKADLRLEGTLNLDDISGQKDDAPKSVEERVAKGEKLSAGRGILPESIALPFPIDGTVRITADAVQTGGTTYKGIVAQVTKAGPAVDVAAKALDIPGKTTAEGNAQIRFGSSSANGKGMIYADPSVSFAATGTSEQLPSLLRAFAPDQDKNPALEIWKTAQFDIKGTVGTDTVSVKNSVIKLDQTTIGLTGSYRPEGAGGRPDAVIDLATDTVDIDYIQSRLNGQKTTAVQKKDGAPDMEQALAPVRSFEMPMNAVFDLSAQKATFNGQTITGIRIKGRASGQSLTLENASAQDFMGAAASLKGRVDNLKDLSGVDLTFYGKTGDLKALLQSFKVDTSKLPQGISNAEADIAAKGSAENLAFEAAVRALDGQLNASGTMTGVLTKPTFSDLTVGAKHPNLVRAIQIMSPAFSGGPGLERPFDFYTKAVRAGDTYDLTGMKATLGTTSLSGDLKINTAGAKPSVSGTLNAGTIPLDDLLANDSGGSSGGGSAAGGGDSSSGKWSREPLETGWMQTVNLDLGFTAQSITYGGWNFVRPSTKITLKDGSLFVDNLNAGLFGGNATLSSKIIDPADPKQPLSLAVQSKMDKVDLEPLMYALSGSTRMKATGDVSLNLDVQGSGLSPHALVSSLQGKATLNGNAVTLKGFDLAQIALAFVDSGKPLDRLSSVVGGATSSGQTRFDTVEGAYAISQGVVTISSMVLDGPAATISSTGNANLPRWTVDTIHTITLKQAKDAGAFNVAIKGPLSSPGNTFGKALFNDVLTRRLQQKVQEKLPDVLGDDLTGKLQGLGILPKKQAPAPTPSPAQSGDTIVVPRGSDTPLAPSAAEPVPAPAEPATAPTEASPATDTPEAAPAVEPPPASEPASNRDDPEKAIQNVLDGLLR